MPSTIRGKMIAWAEISKKRGFWTKQRPRPHYGGSRMADILTIIAAVEWMALGLLFLWKLKDWNKRFQALYDDLKEDVERWKE